MRYELFTPVADLIRQTAEKITAPAQAELSTLDIQQKSDGTIVTRADGAAEAFLTQHLTALLPGSKVLGEETAGNWRTSPLATDKGDVWIIDPIDGTKPYSRGEAYGIMVALRRGGIVEAAWIYYPHTKDMLFASKEDKTYSITWDENGEPLFQAVSAAHPETDQCHLGHYVPTSADHLGNYAPVADLFATHAPCQCIATDIRDILQTGTLATFFINHFTPWDHEPTRLILEQGGGSVCFLQDAQKNLVGGILTPTRPLLEKILSAVQAVNPDVKAA